MATLEATLRAVLNCLRARGRNPTSASEYSTELSGGRSGQRISEDNRKVYDSVLSKFDEFFKVRKNTIFERARFNRRNQLAGESVKHYYHRAIRPRRVLQIRRPQRRDAEGSDRCRHQRRGIIREASIAGGPHPREGQEAREAERSRAGTTPTVAGLREQERPHCAR